jgi:toxoflavin biosynthesis protein ToxC
MRHEGPIAGIAARGGWVATAGYDNKIILWDRASHEALARANHDHLVNDCSFSADGRWLASASSDYSARIWALPSLRLSAVLAGHDDDVDMAVFSADSRRIATCALDRRVRVFDLEGRCLQEMSGHTGNVLSLAWSPDDQHVVSTSVDGTMRRWNVQTGVAVAVTDLGVRTDSVEIGPNGTVYAGDDRGRICIVDGDRVDFLPAHAAGIKKVALDARQGLLASLSYDRAIAVWRIGADRRLREIGRSTLPSSIWARAAAVMEDGRIAVGTFGSTYAQFDPATSKWNLEGVAAGAAVNAVLSVASHVYSVGDSGVVHMDGRAHASMGSLCNFLVATGERVLTGGQAGQLFDAHSGAVLYEHRSPLNCGASFKVGERAFLAIGTYTGEILIFTPRDDGSIPLVAELSVYENAVKGLSCSDGLLFSVCASTDIAWHRVADWALLRRIDKAHDRIANACCAIGNSEFASVGRDRTLRLWRGTQGEVYESPHPNSVKCIAVNTDRTALLTGSYGGTLASFDLVRRCWGELQRPTSAGISSIAWDGSRGRFLAASYDGAIYPALP